MNEKRGKYEQRIENKKECQNRFEAPINFLAIEISWLKFKMSMAAFNSVTEK